MAVVMTIGGRESCKKCRGLGWLPPKEGVGQWARECPDCGGRGVVAWSIRKLARTLNLPDHTVRSVLEMRTCKRADEVLDACLASGAM